MNTYLDHATPLHLTHGGNDAAGAAGNGDVPQEEGTAGGHQLLHIEMKTPVYDPGEKAYVPSLRPQAKIVVMIKHNDCFSSLVGEADTGCQFSLMTVDLATQFNMKYADNSNRDVIWLYDVSNTHIPVIGFLDAQINTVGGAEYQWTRIMVIDEPHEKWEEVI